MGTVSKVWSGRKAKKIKRAHGEVEEAEKQRDRHRSP